MSPTPARIALAALAVLAVALRVVNNRWVHLTPGALDHGASLFLKVIPLVGVIVLFLRSRRRRPASFALDQQNATFLVRAWPLQLGWLVLVAGWTGDAFGTGSEGDWTSPEAIAGIIVIALLIAVAGVLFFYDRPWVALSPSGLTIDRFRSRTAYGWDDLAADAQPKRNAGQLGITLNARVGTTGIRATDTLPIDWLYVDPAFLAAAIAHYVTEPQHRAAIGTEAELVRLREVFAGQLAAAEASD